MPISSAVHFTEQSSSFSSFGWNLFTSRSPIIKPCQTSSNHSAPWADLADHLILHISLPKTFPHQQLWSNPCCGPDVGFNCILKQFQYWSTQKLIWQKIPWITEMQEYLLGLGMLTSKLNQIRGSDINWMILSSSASWAFEKSVSVIFAASIDILWCRSFSFTNVLMWSFFRCLIKFEDTPCTILIILRFGHNWHIISCFVSPGWKNFHTTDLFALDERVLPDPALVNCKWSNFEW